MFRYVFILAFLSCLKPCLSSADQAVSETQPNLVVFLVDDMGLMDSSVPFLTDNAGNPVKHPLNNWYRTPSMERLAKQGIRFSNFYAHSVCSPTRNTIMTGQNAARHRTTTWINPARNNRGENGPPEWNWEGLKSADVTLPGQLRSVGYKTIHVGKGHFGADRTEGENPLNLGFDVNIAGHAYGAPASYYGEKNYGNKPGKDNRYTKAVPGLEKYHGSETYLTEALTVETKAELTRTVKAEQPFYLYMAHYAVHAPFHPDPRFMDSYNDSGKAKNAQAFASMVEGMDKSLGDLMDHLEKLGVAEETLILFLGDNGSDAPLGDQHGYSSSAPLRGKKGAHYEGGLRVPFIAAWAKPSAESQLQQKLPIKPNAVQTQVGSIIDLFPTLLNLANVPLPEGHKLDGADLAPLLTGKTVPSREQVFLNHFPHSPHRSHYFTSYRQGDWKVIYHYLPISEELKQKKLKKHQGDSTVRYELFDLKKDPYEATDLSEKNPKELKRMLSLMGQQLEEYEALYPVDANGNELKPVIPE